METKSINYWIVVGILTLSSIWAMFLYHKDKDITQGIVKMIEVPYEINNWQGNDVDWSQEKKEEIFQILETDKVIMRTYRNPDNDIILLYIVYSKNRASFHPPEYCHEGSGAELTKKEIINIPLEDGALLAYRMIFQTAKGKKPVIVWYMADKQMCASYYKQQLNLMLNALKGRGSQGMMISISTYFQTEDKEKNFQMLKEFVNDLIPYLSN